MTLLFCIRQRYGMRELLVTHGDMDDDCPQSEPIPYRTTTTSVNGRDQQFTQLPQ